MQSNTRTELVSQTQNAFSHDPTAFSGAGGQRGEPTQRSSVLNRISNVPDSVGMKPMRCTACGGIGHISDVCPSVNAF